MFGFHLVKKDEQMGTGTTCYDSFSYLPVYTESGTDIILTISEPYNKDVHCVNNPEYIHASVRIKEEDLIKRFLDIIPFWKIREYVVREKVEALVNQIKNIYSQCGKLKPPEAKEIFEVLEEVTDK